MYFFPLMFFSSAWLFRCNGGPIKQVWLRGRHERQLRNNSDHGCIASWILRRGTVTGWKAEGRPNYRQSVIHYKTGIRLLNAKYSTIQACVATEDNMGRQALHLSAQAGCEKSVRYLIEVMNVNVNVQSSLSGVTALHVSAKVRSTQFSVTSKAVFYYLKSLLKYQCDTNVVTNVYISIKCNNCGICIDAGGTGWYVEATHKPWLWCAFDRFQKKNGWVF